MGEHKHDINYLIIVLFLAFIMVILSVNQTNPELATGHVTRDSGDAVLDFLRSFSSEPVNAFEGNVFDKQAPQCQWISLDNVDYFDLVAMSGTEACTHIGFSSCMMTSFRTERTKYQSTDGTCQNYKSEETFDKIGDCGDDVEYTRNACGFGDYSETGYTMLFCCQ